MYKLLLIVLLTLFATTAMANKPGVPYEDQPKYAKMFCAIAGIPIKLCHRKDRKK